MLTYLDYRLAMSGARMRENACAVMVLGMHRSGTGALTWCREKLLQLA